MHHRRGMALLLLRTTAALVAPAARAPRRRLLASATTAAAAAASATVAADVVVIGGGHAGCEAAGAAARRGAKTVLVTQNAATVGEMSCNPSIGGIGKGHLVREIDALGGYMGECADAAGIHFRMLNRRKGPAVWGPRAQADRDLYREAMAAAIAATPNLTVLEASADDVVIRDGKVVGVKATRADGAAVLVECAATVLTTGTFLNGVCHIGADSYAAGRHLRDSKAVEPPSLGLRATLQRLDLPLGRMKTGTPPRLDGTTINWSVLEPQPSEDPARPFSYLREAEGEGVPNKESLVTCYKTYTNEKTHAIVRDRVGELPEEATDGNGPRYCPSIFKKVERFPDRDQHLVWLEPEGIDTDVVYPNGLSGPFTESTQLDMLRTIEGLEKVEIVMPGYVGGARCCSLPAGWCCRCRCHGARHLTPPPLSSSLFSYELLPGTTSSTIT